MNMHDADKSKELSSIVNDAIKNKQPLRIFGGDTKNFYGCPSNGNPISIAEHSGIINYQAGELVITARAGTSLHKIETVLAKENQRLIFSPPHFGTKATLGGTIAASINGLDRPWSGGVRDAVLGVTIINGKGEILRFGGEVMKNVAGYDVSRLMAGSMGTLGIILDISLKVLPIADKIITLKFEISEEEAIQRCTQLNRKYLPFSAMAFYNNELYVRLSGNTASVDSACSALGGEVFTEDDFWYSIREQTHPFFKKKGTLWRISVPPATSPMNSLIGDWLIDWGGAQRWFISHMDPEIIRAEVQGAHGHATIFRSPNNDTNIFHPLTTAQKHLHKMVKEAFDPHHVFNPGRLYADL